MRIFIRPMGSLDVLLIASERSAYPLGERYRRRNVSGGGQLEMGPLERYHWSCFNLFRVLNGAWFYENHCSLVIYCLLILKSG